MRTITLALLGLLIGGPAGAQPLSPLLNGTEAWNCGTGGPGGPSVFCSTATVRGGTQAVTAVTASATLPNTATTLIITPQPAPTGSVLTLPASPSDGQVLRFCNGTASAFTTNTVTVVVNTGQSSVPTGPPVLTLTTLAANTCQAVQYAASTNTWYRIQ